MSETHAAPAGGRMAADPGGEQVRTTLTAVDVVTSERVDVLLELEPTDLVSTLETAVARLLPPGATGLWLGDVALDPAATVEAAQVRSGVVLSVGGPLPAPALPRRAQLHVVSGPDAGTVLPLPDGDVTIGHGQLPGAGLTPRHLGLQVGAAGVVAADLGASPPVRCAGRQLAGPVALTAADLLEVGDDLVAVVAASRHEAAVVAGDDLTLQVNRPPRLLPAGAVRTVELPTPPTTPEPRRLAVLPLLLPVVLGVVMAVLLNPLFLLFTLMSPLIALSTWSSDRKHGRKAARKAELAHAQASAATGVEIAALVAAETSSRRAACPDAAELLLTATGPDGRLWERRRQDADGLLLRIGTGSAAPEAVQVTSASARPPQPVLLDVPVTVPLREVGVLGVAGPTARARALCRWLVAQSAVLHSPRDLSVWLLVDPTAPAAEPDWGWLRWLPHTAPAGGQDCAHLLADTADALTARIAELTALVAGRVAAAADVRAQLKARRQPDLLVVLDGARALRSLGGLATVLRDGPAVGVHLLCLDEQERLLPEECRAVVTCDGGAHLTLRRTGADPQSMVRGDLVSSAWAERVSRALAPLRDATPEGSESSVPTSARLLDVLSMQQPSPEQVAGRWGRTTAAVVGVDADGPFTLDLRRDGPHALVAGTTGSGKSEFLQTLVASLAVANRPDAMTFVLVDYKGGAAFKDCAHLPHTVGMVTDLDGHLVERALASLTSELKTREKLLGSAGAKDIEDYWAAGGPALPRLVIVIDEFASLVEDLPDFVRGLVGIAQRGRSLGVHLVLATQRPSGVVSPEIRANTNLRVALRVTDAAESLDVVDAPDASLIARSTPGRGFARTGHASLTAFQTARVGGRAPGTAGSESFPVDAHELPWSRLGAPLPPARPSAAEPDQDQTDLHDLVEAIRGAAEAADLPPARSPWLEPLPGLLTLDRVRRPAAEAVAAGAPHGERIDAPAGLVSPPRQSAAEAGPPPSRRPRLPAIPYGLEDLPAEQSQRPAVLDLELGGHLLVAGAPRSGRSTLLRTLAVSLAATVSPSDAHVYALDCGNGALLPLAGLQHCGAVVQRSQVERADRLLSRLASEVARRQELLAERGFADVAEQRAASADPLPYLVLLVDRWEGFTAAFDEVDAGRLVDTFLRLLREGPGAGLRVVLTGDRSALLGKVASAIEDKLVLRMADRSDYALAGLSPRLLPDEVGAGRGFRPATATQVQVAVLAEDLSGASEAGAIAQQAAQLSRRVGRRPFRVDVLPTRLTMSEALALGAAPAGAGTAVGVGGDELQLVTIDLDLAGPGFTVAGPPRSGRSTALLVMASSLLAAGTGLCVLAPRPSPLRDLEGRPGVLLVESSTAPDPAEVAAVLNAAAGPVAVLVDDAELLTASEVAELLQRVLRDGRDRGHVVLVAGATDELAGAFRGFALDVRKSRSGLLLSPTSHLQGELLGVRLARSAAFSGPPGRGLLVRSGEVQLVQVPVPD